MALLFPGCRHTPLRSPYGGMKKIGFAWTSADHAPIVRPDTTTRPDERDADSVAFQCENCGVLAFAPRCAAVTASGTHCKRAVQRNQDTCAGHRDPTVWRRITTPETDGAA